MTPETIPSSLDRQLTNDSVLPAQFFRPTLAISVPERRLRLAILKDALRHFQDPAALTDRARRTLAEDAADWIFTPDRSEPFAFENVCEALGLDPHYIRRGLRRGCRRQLMRSTNPTGRNTTHAAGGSRHNGRRSHRRAA